jgi:predicted adenylyl cyclase CyaB
MARNVEVKARVADLAKVRERALALGAKDAGILDQTDRYYELDGARRVKLRTMPGRPAELITYDRAETAGSRPSDYTVTNVRDDDACVVPKQRPIATVKKRRELLLLDNVRIHLDTVDTLGTFVELEAVLDDGHDDATCTAQVERLVEDLGLHDQVRSSYGEMVERVRRD